MKMQQSKHTSVWFFLLAFYIGSFRGHALSSVAAVHGNVSGLSLEEDAATNQLKFYTLEGGMCPYAARTWITLLELGLPFELVEINAKNKAEWYLDINPRGKVPAIQNMKDGTIVYESAICNEYLSDWARQLDDLKFVDGTAFWHMMPVDASEKAAMRLLNDHVDTSLGPAQYTFLMNDDPEQDSVLRGKLEDALAELQSALISRGGPFLMGGEFTIADAHVLPFFLRLVVSLRHFKQYEIPTGRFSALLKWYDLCSKRESVVTASKSDEKIIEVYQKFVDMKYGFGGLNKNK